MRFWRILGAFVEGKRHGQGVYLYVNGDVFQGEWENDVKHGSGKIKIKIYDADILGTYTYAAGGQKKGLWTHGVLSGLGELIHVDHKILGVFLNDSEMKMPAQLTFPNLSYSKSVANPIELGLALPASE